MINPHGFPKYLLADAHVTITYITCLLCSCDCSFDQTSEPCSLDLIDRRIAAKFSRGLLSGVSHLFKMGKELKPVKMLFRSLTFFFLMFAFHVNPFSGKLRHGKLCVIPEFLPAQQRI